MSRLTVIGEWRGKEDHKTIDIVGKKFGKIKVIKRVDAGKKYLTYLVKCDCGGNGVFSSVHIRKGVAKSCGCLSAPKEWHGASKNGKRERLFGVYKNMKTRCHNPNSPSYKDYGARGIEVCTFWRNSFSEFRRWALSHGYRDDLQIDRINNSKGYTPANCRFVSRIVNSNNKRNNKYYRFNGRPLTIAQASRGFSINYGTLLSRIKSGISPSNAVKKPVRKITTYRRCLLKAR